MTELVWRCTPPHLLYTGVYVHVYHIYCILVYMYMYITSIVYWCICTCISHLLYTGVYVHVYHIYCILVYITCMSTSYDTFFSFVSFPTLPFSFILLSLILIALCLH